MRKLLLLVLITGNAFSGDCNLVNVNSTKEYDCQKGKIEKKYGSGPKFFNKEDPTSLLTKCLKTIAPISVGDNVIIQKENNGVVTSGVNDGRLVFFANIDGQVYELDRSPFVATKENRNYASYILKTPKGDLRYHLFESSSGFTLVTDTKFNSPEYQEKFRNWEKKSLSSKINNYLADGSTKKEVVITNPIQNPNSNKYFISSVVNELNESIKHVYDFYGEEKKLINDPANERVRILDYVEGLKQCKGSVDSLGGKEISALIDTELKKFTDFEKPSLPSKPAKKSKAGSGGSSGSETNKN